MGATKLAVIGCGYWGPKLVRSLHDGETSVVSAVVDIDPARREAMRAGFPGLRVGGDPSAVLDDDQIEAVVVATPGSTHYPLVEQALLRGKDVLVEKPMTHDAAQAAALLQLARKTGRILMVGHVYLFNDEVRAVKRMLVGGELGAVRYLTMTRTHDAPVREDLNAAWDLAAHDISVADYWLEARPVSALAAGGSWLKPGREDAVFATLRYPDNVLANVHVSWATPRRVREMCVVGEKGMALIDEATPGVKRTEPLREECRHFVDCVRSRKPPLTGPDAGLAVVRTLDAVQRSLRSGREELV